VLVAKCAGRIKEDDSSVPAPDEHSLTCGNSGEGGQHECSAAPARRRTDRNRSPTAIARGEPRIFQIRRQPALPDHKLAAWSADIKGSEYFSIRVRGWPMARDHDDVVEETDGAGGVERGFEAFFYVKLDETTARCRLAPTSWFRAADDILVYEERISGWFTHIHESASGRFCVIAGGDHETSEQRLIDLCRSGGAAASCARPEEGVQYSIATAAMSCSSHQCDGAIGLQDRHHTA